jgi:hypothetical protein
MDGSRRGSVRRLGPAALTVPILLFLVPATKTPGQDLDGVRIEHEHTLDVPSGKVVALWAFLTETYDPVRPAVRRFGDEFTTAVSDERFIDRYFDTHDLELIRTGSGIRHRTRFIPGDTVNRKHDRQLVQFKSLRPGESALTRTEVRFRVRESLGGRPRYGYDGHPLVGLIRRSEREFFLALVAEAGLDPDRLHRKLEIRQRRQRIYIHRGAEEYATITLDEVRSRLWWKTVAFHVVEIEANEQTYTRADEETRAFIKGITADLTAEILAAFPTLEPDPTPKYQRVYARFGDEWRLLPLALRYGAPAEVLFAAGLMLLIPGYLLVRNRPQA